MHNIVFMYLYYCIYVSLTNVLLHSINLFPIFRSIKTKLSRDLAESSAWSRRGRAADNGYAVAEDDEVDRFALSELGMLARR